MTAQRVRSAREAQCRDPVLLHDDDVSRLKRLSRQHQPTIFLANFRYAIRSLSRARGFAAVVIRTLGLGIGANTAIFSVVLGVLLKPLPHRDGGRLVCLRQSINGPSGENIAFSVPEILDFRNDAKSLGGIAEYSGITFTLEGDSGDRESSRIIVGLVKGNYFKVRGLSAVLGRLLGLAPEGSRRSRSEATVL